jgi:endonuclease/exonuclease/phosphatase family metal-dependent hydrolase
VDKLPGARLVAYNMGFGGSRDPGLLGSMLTGLAPDLLFVQESRDPARSWLPAVQSAQDEGTANLLWAAVPGVKWGSGLWVRDGHLTPLDVPEDFTGRVAASVVEGREWPGAGVVPVMAFSIHAPTRKGSSYIKEVGRILDFARVLAEGRSMILAGDFNVVVGMRESGQVPAVSKGEKALLERLRDEFCMIPCWQTAHPGERLARTLRWMYRADSLPYHCDGLFVPAEWAPALENCSALESEEWCALSDHNPVVASFAWP